MRKKYIFGKKLYISILTSIVVLMTTIATTFAWVGVFANSTFEEFSFGIKGNEINDYSIQVSADGINFNDSISEVDIKKSILLNWGYNSLQLNNEETIKQLFSKLNLEQCTTVPQITDNKIIKIGDFENLYGESTKRYYKFDFYITIKKTYDESIVDSTFKLDAYLNNDVLTGNIKNKNLVNPYTYATDFINPYDTLINNHLFTLPDGYRTIQSGETISSARVNSADASRIAFEKYEVVDKGHPEQYNEFTAPNSAIIYHTGYDYPVYCNNTNSYSFGSILDTPYNLAIGYFNSTEYFYVDWHYWNQKLPQEIWETRGVESSTKDLRIDKNNNHIIDSMNSNEEISVGKMMKLTCYFWFEGWDADCFNAINLSPVNINIVLSMKNED